jgi:hypothetical protein
VAGLGVLGNLVPLVDHLPERVQVAVSAHRGFRKVGEREAAYERLVSEITGVEDS